MNISWLGELEEVICGRESIKIRQIYWMSTCNNDINDSTYDDEWLAKAIINVVKVDTNCLSYI